MILSKYHVVYVEVPTGYPGVITLNMDSGASKEELRHILWMNYPFAILDILEARRRDRWESC